MPLKYQGMPLGGYIVGLVPDHISPATLESITENGHVELPFLVLDWSTFPIPAGTGERSYKCELRAMRIIIERINNLSIDMRANFGLRQDSVFVGDAKSVFSRVVSDVGEDAKKDILYPELIEIKEVFQSSLVKFLFVSDPRNIADCFTKSHSLYGDKTRLLIDTLQTGYFRAPLSAFLGRSN